MDATNFCYWLQGFIELNASTDGGFTKGQAEAIAQHLKLVLKPSPVTHPQPAWDPDAFQKAMGAYTPGTLYC